MNEKVIGFDIEWKSEQISKSKGPKKNVSLIQVACEDRIALFHLALYPKGDTIDELVSPNLKKILEDPEITKVGVAIKSDCTRVRKHLGIDTRGIFELSHLNKLVKFSKSRDYSKINKSLVSLAKQVQEHLHLPMNKVTDVRSSDWSRPLDLTQLSYAAADSYAGFQLYHTLELKRKALNPTPPSPYHAELNKPIRFAEGIEIPIDGEAGDVEGEELYSLHLEADKPKLPAHRSKQVASDEAERESIKVEDIDPEVPASQSPTNPPSSSTIEFITSAPQTSIISTSKQNSLLSRASARTISHYTSLQ
jgi:hypothetical protein